MSYLDAAVGHDCQQRYWAIFDALRSEVGYADYLGALQRYRIENPRDPNVLSVKRAWGARVTTVFPRQGHYALDPDILATYPAADISVSRIGNLLTIDF